MLLGRARSSRIGSGRGRGWGMTGGPTEDSGSNAPMLLRQSWKAGRGVAGAVRRGLELVTRSWRLAIGAPLAGSVVSRADPVGGTGSSDNTLGRWWDGGVTDLPYLLLVLLPPSPARYPSSRRVDLPRQYSSRCVPPLFRFLSWPPTGQRRAGGYGLCTTAKHEAGSPPLSGLGFGRQTT